MFSCSAKCPFNSNIETCETWAHTCYPHVMVQTIIRNTGTALMGKSCDVHPHLKGLHWRMEDKGPIMIFIASEFPVTSKYK